MDKLPLFKKALEAAVETAKDCTLRRIAFFRRRNPHASPFQIDRLAFVDWHIMDAEIAKALGHPPDWYGRWRRTHYKAKRRIKRLNKSKSAFDGLAA
jgi:hypothetical protein